MSVVVLATVEGDDWVEVEVEEEVGFVIPRQVAAAVRVTKQETRRC